MDFSSAKEYIVTRLVKELPKDLFYHGAHHTFDVVKSAQFLGKEEGVTNEEMLILLTAAYYHDAGFLFQYNDNESFAVEMVKEILPKHDYSFEEIHLIEGIINATKSSVAPQSLLEKIMCDADHDYFGRDNYNLVAKELRKELEVYESVSSDKEWLKRQVNYLRNHHEFYTSTSIKLRLPVKLQHIKRMEEQLSLL